MDHQFFRAHAQKMIDYLISCNENIHNEPVAQDLEVGFLENALPAEAPENPENFDDVFDDIHTKILPGMIYWNHPRFFAYFPSGNSYPSVLADLLSSALGCIGFSWDSSPSMTELETVVLRWLAKALDLPPQFLPKQNAALEGSASECVLLCMMAARTQAIAHLRGSDETKLDSEYLPKLVAYCSKEAHSSVEKAANMALITMRQIETDDQGKFPADKLKASMDEDIAKGLLPFFVVATLGTTGRCVFDNIYEIGDLCRRQQKVWFHVDGAYGGNSFILPEMRKFKRGLEFADSFSINANKFMLTNFDSSAVWMRDVETFKKALFVDPSYLESKHPGALEYRHYGVALSRRFRSLKLWFVMRTYGLSGLRKYMRNHMELAKKFESLVRADDEYEVLNEVHLGLVVFRKKGTEALNEKLCGIINQSGEMRLTPTKIKDKYYIRFCVTYEHATEEHITEAWDRIKYFAEKIKRGLARAVPSRFSFTRSVSREVYDRYKSQNHLEDGCSPIIVLDEDDDIEELDEAAHKNERGRNLHLEDDEVSN